MIERLRAADRDDGFTLIEMIIAMLIMATSVATIVGALASLAYLTSQHRGHAVIETAGRSFGQTVEAATQFPTTLSVAVTDTTSDSLTITVADSSLLPPPSSDSFLVVDREVLLVTANDRSVDDAADDVAVSRAFTGAGTKKAHRQGAPVRTFIRCSRASNSAPDDRALYTPDRSTYTSTTGVAETVTGVLYWRSSSANTGTFVNRDGCADDFAKRCTGGIVLPECMPGYVRVDLQATTANVGQAGYDSRFRNVQTTTSVLVRRSG